MHEFLTANRAELIARCRVKVAQRSLPGLPEKELANGISIFLDQLIKTLIVEQTEAPMLSRKVSGPSGGGKPALSEMSDSATRHGRELQQHGFTLEEVVHDYGDLCQSISDLAVETKVDIGTDEFRTLNRCLDNAIASAVTEFGYQRDFVIADDRPSPSTNAWVTSPMSCATSCARRRWRCPSSRQATWVSTAPRAACWIARWWGWET